MQSTQLHNYLFIMEIFQELMSAVMPIAMICFAVSTGILYVAAKKRGYTPVGVHVESKWSFNLDVRFFSDLRKSYVLMGKSKIIPIVNQVSIFTLVIGFLLIIISEFVRYY